MAQEEQSEGDEVAVAKPRSQPYREPVDNTDEVCSGKEAKECDWTVLYTICQEEWSQNPMGAGPDLDLWGPLGRRSCGGPQYNDF